MRPGAITAALAALLPAALAAQTPTVAVDRIVAVVGVRPILASQLEEEFAQLQASGQPVPQDSAVRAAARRRLLDQMIEMEIMVQEAERDTTVKVTDQEVEEAVEQSAQNVRRNFASELEFQRQLKLAGFGSSEEWRRWLTDNQRRTLLRDRLLEQLRQKGHLKPIPPTDAEMRAFWEENKGAGARRPATVSFRQVVVPARPDSAARASARVKAESLLAVLQHGGDFAALAHQFSADSASAAQGGELGWFRRGVMVKEFEIAAFNLRPGQLSSVVETEFGFHIIRVDRVQPAEIFARHILITPWISPAQVEIARRQADSAHDALAAGAPFDSVARRWGDPTAQRIAETAPMNQLGPEYQQVLAADTTPGLKPAFAQGEHGPRPQFVVLLVSGRQAEGDVGFEDVKDQIRQRLSQDLAVRHYVDQLRKKTYVDVRL